MSKRIKIRLTSESIDKAIAEVKAYRDHIVEATQRLGQALVDEGVEIARMKITAMDAIETGELLGSIEGFFDGKHGYIKTDSRHAAFVEYGTGIVGATNSSIEPKPSGWQHDANNHGDLGWFYQNGRWTKGMPPRPFMWETWLELCNTANERLREIAND